MSWVEDMAAAAAAQGIKLDPNEAKRIAAKQAGGRLRQLSSNYPISSDVEIDRPDKRRQGEQLSSIESAFGPLSDNSRNYVRAMQTSGASVGVIIRGLKQLRAGGELDELTGIPWAQQAGGEQ